MSRTNQDGEGDKTPLGNSKEVIVSGDFSAAVRKERSMELLNKMTKALLSGDGNFVPFVIASKDGEVIAEELIVNPDGTVQLPELKLNTKEDIEQKSKFIRKILKEISPVLRAEIENVTYIALMRKDSKKLEKIMRMAKDKKIKPRLENRAGCIWLVVGDEEVVI